MEAALEMEAQVHKATTVLGVQPLDALYSRHILLLESPDAHSSSAVREKTGWRSCMLDGVGRLHKTAAMLQMDWLRAIGHSDLRYSGRRLLFPDESKMGSLWPSSESCNSLVIQH